MTKGSSDLLGILVLLEKLEGKTGTTTRGMPGQPLILTESSGKRASAASHDLPLVPLFGPIDEKYLQILSDEVLFLEICFFIFYYFLP